MWVPTVSDDVLQWAWPEPSSDLGGCAALPSTEYSTAPVGSPPPEWVTVAVKITDWPTEDSPPVELDGSPSVVGAWSTVTGWAGDWALALAASPGSRR